MNICISFDLQFFFYFFFNFKIFNSYMRSQTWTPLPPPSPQHLSGSSPFLYLYWVGQKFHSDFSMSCYMHWYNLMYMSKVKVPISEYLLQYYFQLPKNIEAHQFSFQSQRKAMPKNAQTTAQLHSYHMLVK